MLLHLRSPGSLSWRGPRADAQSFFFLSAAALHTTHTYTWQREHLRVVSTRLHMRYYSSRVLAMCVWTWCKVFLHLASRPSKRSRAFLDGSRPASAGRVVTYPVPPPLHTRTCRDFKSDLVSIRLRNNVNEWNSFRNFQIFEIFKVRAFFKNLVDFNFTARRRQPHQGLFICRLEKEEKRKKWQHFLASRNIISRCFWRVRDATGHLKSCDLFGSIATPRTWLEFYGRPKHRKPSREKIKNIENWKN